MFKWCMKKTTKNQTMRKSKYKYFDPKCLSFVGYM